MIRRRAISAAFLAMACGLAACSSIASDSSPKADRTTTTEPTTTEVTTTTREEPVTSSQVAGLTEGYESRATEGPDREETKRRLDEAVATIGAHRSNIYDGGDAFEVRVVEPAPEDEAVVAKVQAETSIPLKVVAVPMSEQWLEQSMGRLNQDLATPTASVGADLKAGRLNVIVDPAVDPDLGGEALATRVHDLVAGYLAEGVRAGSVADGVTPDQAVEILPGHFG